MAADIDNNLVEIEGKLIYCTEGSNGMYLSGIAFVGTDAQVAKFVANVVKEYNYRKNNLLIAVA
jgi:UDP-3-O-acyl-N-acetylglucosamine deacetylase